MDILPIMISAAAAFAATLSAGIFIKTFKNNIGVVCAFSAGFFIALSLLNLIPNILSIAIQAQISFEKPLFIAAAGFLVFLALDLTFSKLHPNGHIVTKKNLKPRIGVLSTIEFCSHGFVEGLAIGVGFQIQLGLGIFVAIAVISHDFCDGISTLALMLNSGNTVKSSMGMLLVDAIAPVIGAASTLFFSLQNYFLVFMLSFLAGSFLYIGGGNLLPDANRMNRPFVTLILFALGFLLVLLFSVMRI